MSRYFAPGEYRTREGRRISIDGDDGYGSNGLVYLNHGQVFSCREDPEDIVGLWEETLATTLSLGFKKDDGKPKASLLPLNALMAVAEGFTKAMAPGSKYPIHNYRHGMDWTRPANAGFRHLVAWLNGQDNDSESGDNHLTAAVASLMMVLEMQLTNVGTDDRWPKVVEEQKNASSSNRG